LFCLVDCTLSSVNTQLGVFLYFSTNQTKLDNNLRGCLAEYLFATECLKRGYKVSFPLLDSSAYDCIIDNGKNLFKIQVKSTGKKPIGLNKSVHCRISSARSIYSTSAVDYFAVWVKYYEGFFIFQNVKNMPTSIRLSKFNKHKVFFNNFAFE